MNEPKDPKEIVMAKVTYKDGRKEDITGARFFEILDHVTNMQPGDQPAEPGKPGDPSEKDLLEMFAEMLRFMIDFEVTPQGAPPEWDPEGKTRENLKIILKHVTDVLNNFQELEGPQAVDRIAEFLKGNRDFMPVARPRLIEDFLKLNDGERGEELTRSFKNSSITFTGRLGLDEQKTAELLRMSFTENNPHGAKTNLKTLASLPLTDVMDALGKAPTKDNKKMFVRQLNREILPTLNNVHITLESITENHAETISIYMGGGYFEASTKKDRIIFRFSPEYAQYINTNSLSQYHRNTFRLGSARNPLPYYLNIKLQDHYYKDANRQRETNMILSIMSLLEFCADTLQYEYILKTDPTHWKRKIKERLERALNDIQEAGVFNWNYCGAKGKEIPQTAIEAADFDEWTKLYITFQLIPEEPDQGDRLENKRKRIAAAIEKKAIEDDRATVEAEKIRKKRRRKTAQKSKKGSAKAPKG